MEILQDKQLGDELQVILDCFSGADTSFYDLCLFLNEMTRRMATGDKDAFEIVCLVGQFSRLIKTAQKCTNRNIT